MKPTHKFIAILVIFLLTVGIGFAFWFIDDNKTTNIPQVESDSEISYGVPPFFETMNTEHTADPNGLEPYILMLRLYRADMLTFDELLDAVQKTLSDYGIIQPFNEPGQFGIQDVGLGSRFQIVTQKSKNNYDAAVFIIDVQGSAPYTVSTAFRGPFHFIDVDRGTQTVNVIKSDGSVTKLSWGDIGVY